MRCQEEEEEFGNAAEEFLADLRFNYDIYTLFPLCSPNSGPFMHWMRLHQRREQMAGVGDHFLSTCQGKGTIESLLAYALCPIGSPLGDLGPLGDLFVGLGPL